MKISIIIPCYNNAPHLPKCIESVLSQSFTDFELLLLNDGSMDVTLEICKGFQKKDARIKVFSHENKGVSYTRNRGITLALSDYLVFIDADDWVAPCFIESIYENTNHNIQMNVCGMLHEKKGRVVQNEIFKSLIRNNILEFDRNHFVTLFPSSALSSPCCKVFSKNILINKEITFDESLSFQEDLIFNLQYIQHLQKIIIIPNFYYHYVEHAVSSTSRFHKNLGKSIFKVNELLTILPNFKNNIIKVQQFKIDQVLKLLSNVLHHNSDLTLKCKYLEIKKILTSTFFIESKGVIKNMQIGKLLKFGLLNKTIILIMVYFKFNSLLKQNV